MTTRQPILLLAALLAMSGCASHNIAKMNPVLIPSGLDAREVKAAMVQAIMQKDIAPVQGAAPNAWAGMVDSLLSARVWGYQSQFNSRTARAVASWYVESIDPASVTYGYKRGQYYMSVRYEIDIAARRIIPKVLLSENLRQTGDSIHPNAVTWITDLSTRIRETLGQFSALKPELTPAAPAGNPQQFPANQAQPTK